MTYRKSTWTALVAATLFAGATLAQAQTVILVRHAEKAAEPKADPALTPAGQARAELLATTLRDAHLTHVVTSKLQRTRDTAAPSAKAAGVTPTALPDVAVTVALVKSLPRDAVVLVVGHSNTVPLIAAGLGATAPREIPDCAFDRMLVMSIGRAPPATVATRYGTAAANCPD